MNGSDLDLTVNCAEHCPRPSLGRRTNTHSRAQPSPTDPGQCDGDGGPAGREQLPGQDTAFPASRAWDA